MMISTVSPLNSNRVPKNEEEESKKDIVEIDKKFLSREQFIFVRMIEIVGFFSILCNLFRVIKLTKLMKFTKFQIT